MRPDLPLCETIRAIKPINPVDAIAADIGANQRDQYVSGISHESDVYRPADREPGESLRQATGEGRHLAGIRIDPRDPARHAFGNI